ncbi:unnamed protein product [Discosporangium mesarthrocarpum]
MDYATSIPRVGIYCTVTGSNFGRKKSKKKRVEEKMWMHFLLSIIVPVHLPVPGLLHKTWQSCSISAASFPNRWAATTAVRFTVYSYPPPFGPEHCTPREDYQTRTH